MQIKVIQPHDPVLAKLVLGHPHVEMDTSSVSDSLSFRQGDWLRHVSAGDVAIELRGLVELMDNNPLVCADCASVPDPVATLGLIALGPALRAGVVLEDPVLQTNASGTGRGFWETTGWTGEVVVAHENIDLANVLAATGICVVDLGDSSAEELYDEAFERSFYVRHEPSGPWDTALVENKPWAVYRLKVSGDTGQQLLTVQVMADRDGKCGAAQLLHAFNVMVGFEESLGIPDLVRLV